jgi:hypothetical protein
MSFYSCRVPGVIAGLIGLVVMTGCLSDNPGSRSIAYVDILTHSESEIRAEAVRIFADDDYKLVRQTGKEMEFERDGTQRDQVMFGSYGDHLVMRIVVIIEPRRQGGYLVRADAYAVNSGDITKVMRVAKRPYQNLLDQGTLPSGGGLKSD